MKKTKKMVFTALVALALASCGSKADEKATVDLGPKVKELCDCYIAGNDDTTKFLECEKTKEEFRATLEKEVQKDFDKKLAKCLMDQ